MGAANNLNIYQFKITLMGSNPKIWRRIQVPAHFNFYQLHTAIQCSMGWLSSHANYHLHEFEILNPKTSKEDLIGIPDPDDPDETFQASLMAKLGVPHQRLIDEKHTKIANYFSSTNTTANYKYDFGDNWEHEVLLESIFQDNSITDYPKCIAGERACPFEDSGNVPGYERILKIIANPVHKEHEDMKRWLEIWGHYDGDFDPEEFDPRLAVKLFL